MRDRGSRIAGVKGLILREVKRRTRGAEGALARVNGINIDRSIPGITRFSQREITVAVNDLIRAGECAVVVNWPMGISMRRHVGFRLPVYGKRDRLVTPRGNTK